MAATAAAAARRSVLQLKRLTLVYCEKAGSSRNLRQYAEGKFNEFAARHETIECTAAIAPGKHPQLIGEYANGARHSIGVKNLGEADIVRRVELLRNRAGYKVQTRDAFNRVIRTTGSGSVQGVWGGVGPARDVVDPKMPRLRKTRT